MTILTGARHGLLAGAVCAVGLLPFCAFAQSGDTIKIGVIGEESSVAGASLTKAAVMAADEINAKGGVNGRKVEVITYDDHSSAADAVRAFQRAVSQDKVVAVIGSYISEVVLAIEPWSARLHMPFITPGAASNLISKAVHDDYDHYKYTFHGWLTSAFIAQAICDYTKDMLVGPCHMKTAVVMSEDAAWTTPLDDSYLRMSAEGRSEGARPHPLQSRHHRLHADLQSDRGRPSGRDHHRHQPCRRAADRAMARPAGADPDGRTKLAGHHQHVLEGHQWRSRRRHHRDSRGARRGAHALNSAVLTEATRKVRRYAGLRRVCQPTTWSTSLPKRSSGPAARPIRKSLSPRSKQPTTSAPWGAFSSMAATTSTPTR